MSFLVERTRAWLKGFSNRFIRALVRSGFVGTIGAPRVRDRNPVTGEVKVRFRHDVRIDAEIYEVYRQLCEEKGETPSARTRKLIWAWIMAQHVLDPWEEFVKKRKSEGFSTPQEWLKAKLDLEDV